ncbi:hypothetical protein PPTG_24354 [Phytophthora nicotianae INRA-310]|uniref:Uncharacterized protein n=1 Tax=Phytophthora nicotianae (strain INRA-310) TaxID=761204 RepID=W2PIV6_PHYN3|nr:hypothetical protein PPTG_24354 [Phytophthora nicotianae INRA-310]ETM99959.1 hypothetical protein PPTG_24354 [Phytophthora nicotianae INRA-310]
METGLTIPTPPRAQATARTLQKGHDCERQVSLLTALGTAAVVADKQTKAPKRFHYYIPFVGAVCKYAFENAYEISHRTLHLYRKRMQDGWISANSMATQSIRMRLQLTRP